MCVHRRVPINEPQKPLRVAVSPGGVCVDSGAAECVSISLHSLTCPDFCLQSAEMKHGATSWVIREVAMEDGDRESLGFD